MSPLTNISNKFEIKMFNARSLKNKLIEFQTCCSVENVNAYFVCETWLDDTVSDAMVCPADYCLIRKYRCDQLGGGIICLLKNNLRYCLVEIPIAYDTLEILSVDIYLSRKHRFIFCYRPPAVNVQYTECFCQCLRFLLNVNFPVSVLGDFNFPDFNWANFNCPNNAS